ncbi:RNA recognition motif domain-containing protein [Mucilaginibacter psychrotolerans]|uniref:RNA-binding protein n=1 Tax=Mucilaginibacter psychrotolerans TaxID=1524096 RepID=A0A4Y8SD41_9SPHI|nr:RNA-binding protein [Mucilaginibacter psychrotolerans]TFF36939.1 RNA-binding protein [Mucilaginibacter psychrotolerans]
MIKIFVSGFSLDITEMELVQMFDPYCPVVTIKIVRDKKTRVCKGYAFLEVATEEDAQNAVNELDGSPIADRFLTVKITREEDVKKKPAPSSFGRRPATTSNYSRVERQPAAAASGTGLRPRRPRNNK